MGRRVRAGMKCQSIWSEPTLATDCYTERVTIDLQNRTPTDRFSTWVSALEARHLADLTPAEVARALRALSSAYVERRNRLSRGAALDGAGKRAAFALFYGPLHFLTTRHIVRALRLAKPVPDVILDLGCGTGAGGAAWALEADSRPGVTGIDRHPWAVEEARWTYRVFGLDGDAHRGDVLRTPLPSRNIRHAAGGSTSVSGRPGALAPGAGDSARQEPSSASRARACILAYTVNELDDAGRAALLPHLLRAAERGSRILIIEPIGRIVGPWWQTWRAAFDAGGGRADEWRFEAELPPLVARFDRASGLDHRKLTARSLYLPPRGSSLPE
jgi:hypothetical protein